MSITTVYAVFGSTEEASRIGRQMIEERLAACVNVLGACSSIYRWQGKVQQADEVPAIFKTSSSSADELVRRIAELHSYDNPAIAAWTIDQSPDAYGRWVRDQMR